MPKAHNDGNLDNMQELTVPTHVYFNPGMEAIQPCESGFLDALIRDLALLTFFARLEYLKTRNLHPVLSENGTLLAKRLDRVMDQCYRLQGVPHLFPSNSMRDAFFAKIAQLSSLLEIVADIAMRKVAFERATSSPISNIERPFTNQELAEIGAAPIVAEPPPLHPNRVGALNPWNAWLNNHVAEQFVAGCIGIEQRIPRVGDRLIRMLGNTYDAIQEIFEEDELVNRDLKNDPLGIPEPGYAYKHMQLSAFRTIPIHDMHFKIGHRKSYDCDGVITAESISKELGPLHESVNGYPRGEAFDTQNCAYFRFAMAYRPEEPSERESQKSPQLTRGDQSLGGIQHSNVPFAQTVKTKNMPPSSAVDSAIPTCGKITIKDPFHETANDQWMGYRDIFSTMASFPELSVEVAKYLPINDLISLYAISKPFHGVVNGYMAHFMRVCAEYNAPESARVFMFPLYQHLCISDPVGHSPLSGPLQARKIPSLRWLQMVIYKESVVRDILACMARQGHRMPKGMGVSLKKMWLTMEIATTRQRVQLMQSKYFGDLDIYHIQLFIIKLDMRFNDPVDGPGDATMRKIFLGQKGLGPLWKLLKRVAFTDAMEVVKLGIRYAYTVSPEHKDMPLWDIAANEIGRGHLEGWGRGRVHLARPDELIIREAVRRRLDLKNHLMEMMLWGYVDPTTGVNVQVTEDEMYMGGENTL
ncbi:hypothetical protein G7Y89_g7859 [Cudoniella acicularis]|uniref:Uncharacterized protein n=1 Tax=Cudoniella acicularis TaxID=354080 RepID=A0A8H4RKE6_9HELO|nr:hypothetical protein G7Y89_g7859 [Cudoniella acicularis]